jgi:putative spermidine/putrescine transport system substrate-binding protein
MGSTSTTQPDKPFQRGRRINRRGFAGGLAAAGVGLVACGSEDSPEDEVTPSAEAPLPPSTEEPTQAPPTPTQAAVGSPVAGYVDPQRWRGRAITVASAGVGAYLDALTTAFFDAFALATGADVQHQEFGRDGISSLKGQVESGELVWDAMLVPTAEVLGLSQGGVLTAIDYNVVDPTALYDELTMQHGVGAALYSTVMVSSSTAKEEPEGWDDFWDLSLFGGTRALRRSPVGTLEFALLADGVSRDELYPLDIERAFTSLERIRAATRFYEDSKQPVELVRTGQVGLASAWNVRTTLTDVASLVQLHWNGGMVSADSWVVPRGAPNADVAMSFINFATRAVPSANFSLLQPFGPINKDALALLRPDVAEMMPNYPANLEVQFFENWSYWRDQREPLTAQFEDWLLNPPATPEAAG